ncbi:gasdermin-C-like [Tenrec ecaudatus]|uniref:gasdermin-C-like n=1 Tax=Tenrec ecaudatus TaxID=94439 RepID=UPI003F59F4CC
MPSTLENYVKKLLEKTGKGDLKPIKDISVANKLQQFNVIWKERRSFSLFSKVEDKPAEFSILDILEDSGSSSAPETVSSKPIPIQHLGSQEKKLDVDGKVQGKGLKVHKEKMDLPEDTVIAYQRKQLVFKEDGWRKQTLKEAGMEIKLFRSGRIEQPPSQNFNLLQEEIDNQMRALDKIPRKRHDTLFHSIQAMLRDGEDFQNLMNLLEENSSGHLEGHGGTILSELQKNSEDSGKIPVRCLLYLLEAVMVLTDIQHDLLAQSMERRILAQQRELVKSILQPNFKYPWCIPFTLKPELLAGLHDEELDITYGLLEECGLSMEPNNPRSTWDVEAKQPLCSLYGTLSLLQQLVDP